MEKEFIPYEQALELKELGFDEPCLKYQWNDTVESKWMSGSVRPNHLHIQKFFKDSEDNYTISIPTFSQAFRWFRDKYNLCGWVQESYFKGRQLYQYHISRIETLKIISNVFEGTFEEAELDCLKKLIKLVKTKN